MTSAARAPGRWRGAVIGVECAMPSRRARTRPRFPDPDVAFLNRSAGSGVESGRTYGSSRTHPLRFHPPSLGPGAPIGQAPPVLSLSAAGRGGSVSPGCSDQPVQNRAHGTHLVRTDLHPAARQGRRRRQRPLPVGRRARPAAGSPATSSPSATPTTAARRSKATKLSRDGGTVMPTSLEAAFVLDGPGEYEVHDVLSPACGPTATTRRAPSAAGRRRSSSSSTGSTRSTSATSATC